MAIGAATITTDVWKTTYDTLVANLTDPQTRGISASDWVFGATPDPAANDHPGYPIITIESPTITNPKLTYTKKNRFVDIRITVHSGSNQYLKSVIDQVQNILDTNNNTILAQGFGNFNWSTDTQMTEIINLQGSPKKIHHQTMRVTYRGVKQ